MLCGDLIRKEIHKRGDMCTRVADSLCCTVEITNLVKKLYSNKTSLKRRRKYTQRSSELFLQSLEVVSGYGGWGGWYFFFFCFRKKNEITFKKRSWIFFYWSIIDLQCCVDSRYTTKWFSYTHAYIHTYIRIYISYIENIYIYPFQIFLHHRLLEGIEYSSQCYTVDMHCLSVSYIVVSIC